MLGAIAGDIIGSPYEASPIKRKDFPPSGTSSRFTDDTVLTVAVADCLLHQKAYAETFHDYVARHPRAGYGATFIRWALARSTEPYNSWGNGAAMRVSPIAWAARDSREALEEAARSAKVTHKSSRRDQRLAGHSTRHFSRTHRKYPGPDPASDHRSVWLRPRSDGR